jgi:competence protein ComEA
VNTAQRIFTQKVVSLETVVEVPSSTLEERLADAVRATAEVKQMILDSRLEQRSLKEAFEHAIAEVAAENDLLVAQSQKLTAALAAVPGVSIKPTQSSEASKATPQPAVGKVNINTATIAELDGLPGIGPSYAERIIAYRKEHGSFTSPEDIQNVTGIGPATFAKIVNLITV